MSPDKLEHAIASAFTVVKDRTTSSEICIICPVPGCQDKTGNRFVNTKTLFTHCYRCEGKQPRHVKSLFWSVGLEFEDQHILEPDELQALLKGKVQPALTPVQEVELPTGFQILRENRHTCYWRFCKAMADRKHLAIEDLEEAEAGFTREGLWEPFCIFPVTEGPRVVYYQGRTYTDEWYDRTKKFPSRAVVPYGMGYWIYNLDALAAPEIELVVVVESILNVLSLKKRLRELGLRQIAAICVFTHFVTRSQIAKMMRYTHIKEWCLLFDSDSTELAEGTAMSISTVLRTTLAEMPKGTNPDGTVRKTNDANDDVDSALTAIWERRKPNPDFMKRRPPPTHDKPQHSWVSPEEYEL